MTSSTSTKISFTSATSDLLKKLQVVAGAIKYGSTLPILDNFLFALKNGNLELSATDLETSVSTALPVSAQQDGGIAMPAKMLLEILKSLPEQPLTFDIDTENNTIEIISNNGKYKLAGEPADDFPIIPQASEDIKTISLPASILARVITQSIFAVSNDELRPSMTGVYTKLDAEGLTFVATDAQKLVKLLRTDQTSATDEEKQDFIIPKKALSLLKNALPSDDTPISLSFDQSNAFFSFANTQLVCRLIDANFPNYEAVIPIDNPNAITINRKDFQNSLKRIAIFANKTTFQAMLDISEDNVTISAQDIDYASEAKEVLSCQFEGEPMKIAFNARFLIEMLNVITTDDIRFELSQPSKAGIMLPAIQHDDERVIMLVMPIMINV